MLDFDAEIQINLNEKLELLKGRKNTISEYHKYSLIGTIFNKPKSNIIYFYLFKYLFLLILVLICIQLKKVF